MIRQMYMYRKSHGENIIRQLWRGLKLGRVRSVDGKTTQLVNTVRVVELY